MRLNDVRSYYKKKITLEFPAKEKWLNFKSWMTARSNYAKGLSGGNKIKFQENRWKKKKTTKTCEQLQCQRITLM